MENLTLKIREQVLMELNDLGYAEKNDVDKEANSEFIRNELVNIKTWKKSNYLVSSILIIATLYLISQAIRMFGIDLTEIEKFAIIFVLVIYFISSLILVYQLALIQKREALVKILSILVDN
jgi:hypothetical protein